MIRRAVACRVATIALAVVGVLLCGCAEVAKECVGNVLQVTAQACVDFVCGDDSASDVDTTDGAAPSTAQAADEVPPSQWTPREGACDVRDDERDASGLVVTRVSCADGTRAVFVGSSNAHLEREEHHDADKDAPCMNARVVVQGVDVDGNGALDPTEITGRIDECPDRDGVRAPTLVGHLTIFGPDDVARLAGRRAITGGIAVKSASLVELALPQLQSVGGTLRVDDTPRLASIALVHLASVGGDVVVERAPALARVDVRTLRKVGGSVVVTDNPKLAQSDVEAIVFHLSEHGFSGAVDVGGNLAR